MMSHRAVASLALATFALADIFSEPAELATALYADDECATDAASSQCSLELAQLRASKLPGANHPSKQSLEQHFERGVRRELAKATAMEVEQTSSHVATIVAGLELRAQRADASSLELGRAIDELENELKEMNSKQETLNVSGKAGVVESHAKADDVAADLAKHSAATLAAQEAKIDTNEMWKTKATHTASAEGETKQMTSTEEVVDDDEVERKDEDEAEIKKKHTEHEDDKLWNRDHRLCDLATALDLSAAVVVHSNLGGQGPDSGAETLVYEGISSTQGQQVDMVVSAISGYNPHDSTKNGIHDGAFGMINMEVNTATDLLFRFVSHATGSPLVMHPFYFTFFDLDQGMAHESREQITIKGFSSYRVANETELTVTTASDDEATFVSTYRGGKVDNPTFPNSLSELQRSRSVAARFADLSEFSVTLGEMNYASPQGRNFMFSGPSSLVCPRESKCSTYHCPSGYHIRTAAEFLVCADSPCTEDDIETCCYEELGDDEDQDDAEEA